MTLKALSLNSYLDVHGDIQQISSNLSSKIFQLEPPCDSVANKSKRKAQLKPNITAKGCFASLQGYWAYKPDLAHANDHTCNTTTECEDSCDARRKFRGLVVNGWVVCGHATLV
jgi:hypothetical protein